MGWPQHPVPQPPKAPIYTSVMTSKWSYVDRHRDAPTELKEEGLSSIALSWRLTRPFARVDPSEEQE